MQRRLRAAALASAVLAVSIALGALGFAHGTLAAFSDSTSAGVGTTSAPDWLPPSVSASVIGKQAGNEPGYIKQGGGYYVYANVLDTGQPASGLQTVTADVSSLTSGQTAVPLNAGTFNLYGVTYNRRSNLLAANAALEATTYAYTTLARDLAANEQTGTGFSVVVDNTAPAGSDFQSANVEGGTSGMPEPGDTITFTYDDVIDTGAIMAGWTGGPANVVMRIVSGNPNRLQVWNSADTAQLPLTDAPGVMLQRNGWVASGSAKFGATGTPSTMVRNENAITITLGTHSGSAVGTVNQPATASWTPSASATDRAGNAASTATVTESGSPDREF